MALTAAEIFRDWEVDNVPASAPHEPEKADIRIWGALLELSHKGAAGLVYANLAALNADLAHDEHSGALVVQDGTPANNGQYSKVGASGVGSWTRVGDLPDAIVPLTVTGGTANAIIASAPQSPMFPGSKLYLLVPTANNTAASSISINGGALAGAIKDVFGNDTAANALVASSPVLMMWSVDRFRLITASGADASGILAAALAAQAAAAASATAAAASASALANQVHQYDTLTLAAAATIPGGVNGVRTFGRGTVGDCPPIFWTRISAPGAPRSWHFQSADGQWWLANLAWFVWASQFGTGKTNTVIQDALDYLKINGLSGGRVTLDPNQISPGYTGTTAPVVWNGLTLDYNGSKVSTTLSGSACYGTRVGDNAEVCNGWAHSIDGGITGSSFAFGPAITLGVNTGTSTNLIGSRDYFDNIRPRVRNMRVSTTRLRCPSIQVVGDVDFVIENIELPDDATSGGISVDWGDVGASTIAAGTGVGGAFASDLERLTLSRTAFNNGTYISTHPRGRISGVRAGKLTATQVGDTGTRIVRLSACRDIIVDGCSGKELTSPAVEIVGGDLGFEFAPIEVLRRAYHITVRDVAADLCHQHGLYVDTNGDNLGNAIAAGYVSRSAAIARGSIIVSGIALTGTYSNADTNDGIRIQNAKGVWLFEPKVNGFQRGIGIEDNVDGLWVRGGEFFANRGAGGFTKAVTTIGVVEFEDVDFYGNGTNVANSAGLELDGGSAVVVRRCLFGKPSGVNVLPGVAGTYTETQHFGLYINGAGLASNVTIDQPICREVASGGIAFAYGNSGGNVLWLARGEQYLGSAGTPFGGQLIRPVERLRKDNGTVHTRCIALAAALGSGYIPPSGAGSIGATLVEGDLIEVPDAGSGQAAIARKGASSWAPLINVP